MKLLRFGLPGAEKPGILDHEGTIRDLSSVIPDLSGATISRYGLEVLRKVDLKTLPAVAAHTRLGAPIANVRHFIAVGLNYVDHALETDTPIPNEPVIFSKAPSCIVGPNDNIIIPKNSSKLDWEAEIAVVIGEAAYDISEAQALAAVAGYLICHDVSERDFQINRGGQWIKGKSAPTFGPLGPWLVTSDEIENPQQLNVSLRVNGVTMQAGTTAKMIFSIAHVVSYISKFMALEPGDIITTGTPHGVGLGKKPPLFLQPNDVVEISIDGLGSQRQVVVSRLTAHQRQLA
ncbi:2-hydroxyhepta-2,4-diene-1,7-dioate isomerase [Mesorhizobium loti]|uniref:2-hydroxyhepta-2,4-diene-1,7-dioate isomerase n=1 Tax=Rhizobium loti TaxID=381 RepID=A0A101KX30_RHILI|nr:2-hydroxyhepta-2,4-diene-1,7-dioate isomerase [Mesorhizobium loti]